ncbi:unnamed protein product [Candidula unifasciata]|uniref:Uncharacterized protein n=1 Tax=Candidula unifasciata TaxID=100452 RepID=A0A8S3YIR4_9EUPU|nr:unnamed protein product [Candidula unifasciata]
MATYRLPRRRLPTLLLARLLEDIKDLVMECRTGNVKTIHWGYSVIAEAAAERYLNLKEKVIYFHKNLAEYFSAGWTGKAKDNSDNLLVNDRPYNDNGRCFISVCKTRSLSELPYHLLKCQKISQLKLASLCNFEWMLARLCGTSLESLLEDYEPALRAEPRDSELKIVMNALLLSRNALKNEPRQLASQLIGRLQRIVTADNPRSPGDPKAFPILHLLLASAKQPSIPSLIPSVECLFEPGGITPEILSGHLKAVSAVTLTTDGNLALTGSQDGTIKVWDVRSGKIIHSIHGVTSKVCSIRSAMNNTLVITVDGSVIRIWDMNSGVCVFTIAQYIDPARISIAAEGMILVGVYDGSNMLRSWNLDGFSMLCQTHIPDTSIHKDNSILIADSSRGDNILHAFRSGNSATVQNARNGRVFKKLQCHEKTSSVVALAITSDYLILCCRQKTVSSQEIHALELFDTVKGTYTRTVRGCENDNITQLTTNSMGSHAIASSSNLRIGTSDIAVFNLETEGHKHLAPHSGISTMCVCFDFRCCVTGDAEDKCLRVWNLSPVINVQVPKSKKVCGLSEIWPMVDNPRYVVTKAANDGPISIWNVTKGKCLQSAVRIERGLTEGTDALVIRNTTLVILTDRGLSSVIDDPLPVFRTVLVYDLKLKKYIRKLAGCYIVPAPSHEYTLLESDSLLGLSDNRSHFIVWSLVKGHVVFRIKTAFREMARAKVDGNMGLVDRPKVNRRAASKIAAMEIRAQSKSARNVKEDSKSARRRLEELGPEKENAIDQFLVSGDEKTIVASFYAHHLCVFDIPTHTHTQTLQTDYSMMLLHTAALTFGGTHLVHANYDEVRKASYITMWDCVTGEVKRRLKGETEVCVVGITDDAQRVVIGRAPGELHIWDPMQSHSLKRIRGYPGFKFQANSRLILTESGDKAIVFSGDITVWDLMHKNVQAVFTPDSRISVCKVILNGKLILIGLCDKPELVVLKLASRDLTHVEDTGGVELFGETTGDTSEEENSDELDNETDN